jgi:hypothetical protein
VYICDVAKSLGFSFGQKKEKAKPKGFALCTDINKKFPYHRNLLCQNVSSRLKKSIS